ncbi:MAG TPA: hypothetical protein VJN01_00910 [Xanthomonadales bacterium]|nr:hypothetical protein [Xanthomonadales bacterium]
MKRFVQTLFAWSAAVLASYALACFAATQSVVGRLGDMGIPVSLAERLQMSGQDLLGMAGLFLPLIAVGLLLAFLVAGFLGRRSPQRRTVLFILAGAMAMISIHLALQWSFDITLVAVARTPLGLLSQALAGVAGGYLYTLLKRSTT